MRPRRPARLVRKRGSLWRHDHVPWYRRPYAKGAHGPLTRKHEDQDRRASGTQVLCLDRRLHPRIAQHVPKPLVLKARV
jgi:hypothetical protein